MRGCVCAHFRLAYANAQIQDDLRLSVIYAVEQLFTPTYFLFVKSDEKKLGFWCEKVELHRYL